MDKYLHIIAFDIPSPPNYGGVIDVFYKIEALNKLGVKIILHCWQYGKRTPDGVLESLCHQVYYYKRNRIANPFNGPLPYIVKTRYSAELVERLKQDNYPILFEGLHTTAPLYYNDLPNRFTIIRNHNIESDYYRLLSEKETKPFKKTYLKQEAKLLFTYEDILAKASVVAAISLADQQVLSAKCNSIYVPAFHPNNEVNIIENKEGYCLYHGNLAVAENDEAALFLVNEVFSNSNKKLIIAGNTASKELKEQVSKYVNVELQEHLAIAEFDKLIQNASLNVLPTFQPTGIKLKLLNALYKGKHCLVNNEMVANSGLGELCTIANSAQEFIQQIDLLFSREFTTSDLALRSEKLRQNFSNAASAQIILNLLP